MQVKEILIDIKKMKKDIESLKNESKKENDNYEYNTSLVKYNLNNRERKIFQYIRDTPGCSKQAVVDYFKTFSGLSRNPTFRIINSLIQRQYVIEERDDHNKNSRKLFINEKNILFSVSNEMELFENSFLEILKHLSLVLPDMKNVEDKKQILEDLDHFYNKFITIYVFRAIPAFMHMINDKQTLYELYKIIYNKIFSVQIKYYEFNNPIQKLLNIPYYKEICTDDEYDREMELFSNNGMQSQIVSLVERLDSINFRYGRVSRIL